MKHMRDFPILIFDMPTSMQTLGSQCVHNLHECNNFTNCTTKLRCYEAWTICCDVENTPLV